MALCRNSAIRRQVTIDNCVGTGITNPPLPTSPPFQVYQYYSKPMRTVYHIALSSDGRYTPREGRYHYRQVPTVETTYLYPQALGRPYVLVPPKHALPTYRQLQLHNPLLNQVKFQPKKGEQPTAQLRMP